MASLSSESSLKRCKAAKQRATAAGEDFNLRAESSLKTASSDLARWMLLNSLILPHL